MKAVSGNKAGGSAREVKVSGRTYRMSQVTVGTLADVENWAREQPYIRLKKKLADFADAPEGVVSEWYKKADEDSQSKEYVQRELESINGVRLIIRKCFEVYHPDLSDDLFTMIENEIGLASLQEFLDRDNKLPGYDDKREGAGNSTEKK
jgi:hypothetical protein